VNAVAFPKGNKCVCYDILSLGDRRAHSDDRATGARCFGIKGLISTAERPFSFFGFNLVGGNTDTNA
jgi:hypothetical protein